jgi:streptogramin lyase
MLFVVGSLLASVVSLQPFDLGATAESFENPSCYGEGRSIAAGPDGNIWFGQSSDREIARLTLPSGPIDEVAPRFAPEGDIVAGPDGNVWAISGVFATVVRPDMTSDDFELPWTTFSENGGTTAGADGNIWLVRRSGAVAELVRIAPDRTATVFTPSVPFVSRVGELLAGPDGALWFFAKLESDPAAWRLFRATYDVGDVREIVANPANKPVNGPFVIGSDVWFARHSTSLELVHVDATGIVGVVSGPAVTGGGFPLEPAVGSDGRIWFSGSHDSGPALLAVGLDGTRSAYPQPLAPAEHMRGLTSGPDGRIWFTTNTHVRSAGTDGVPGSSFEIPLSRGPVVTCSVSPDQGATFGGDIVTIRGRGFSRATQVLFDNLPLAFTIVSDFEIHATTRGAASGDHYISVRSVEQPQSWSSVPFRSIGPPKAASACPAQGPITGGYWIKITGRDMDSATFVRFGDRGTTTEVRQAFAEQYGVFLVRHVLYVRVPAGHAGPVRLYASGPYGTGPAGGVFVFARVATSGPCVDQDTVLGTVDGLGLFPTA